MTPLSQAIGQSVHLAKRGYRGCNPLTGSLRGVPSGLPHSVTAEQTSPELGEGRRMRSSSAALGSDGR